MNVIFLLSRKCCTVKRFVELRVICVKLRTSIKIVLCHNVASSFVCYFFVKIIFLTSRKGYTQMIYSTINKIYSAKTKYCTWIKIVLYWTGLLLVFLLRFLITFISICFQVPSITKVPILHTTYYMVHKLYWFNI